MTSSNSSTERLRRLTRLNLRGDYRRIVDEYRKVLNQLETSELLVVGHAAATVKAHKVLGQIIPSLREKLGNNAEVLELSFWYVNGSKDRKAAIQLAWSLSAESLRGLAGKDLAQFCTVLATVHAWSALARVLELAGGAESGDLPPGLLGPRAVLRWRRRDYANAFLDAEAALERSGPGQRVAQRWLLARVAQAAGDHETAARTYKSAIGQQTVPTRTAYRAAWSGLWANRLPFAESMLEKVRESGAGGSGVDKLTGYLAAARDDYAGAEAAFARVLDRWPDDDDALIGWFDSRAQQVSLPDALSDLDALLQRHDTPELNLRRIALLRELGHTEQADYEYRELQRRFPHADADGLRGRNETPLARLGTRQAVGPGNAKAADGSDPEVVDAIEVPNELPAVFQPQWTQAELRRAAGLSQVLAVQTRVLVALMMREVKTRYGRRKLGYVWAFFEPALHAGVLYVLWSFRGKTGFDGMPLLVFLITGIVPFFLFSSTFSRVGGAVQANKSLLAHRHVTPFDAILSRAVLELLTRIAVLAVFLTGIGLYFYEIDLIKPLSLWSVLMLLWVTGIGVGLIAQALTPIFASIQSMLQVLMRALYLTSGVIFPMSVLPRSVQEYALYNPILHLIQYCRYAFLHGEPITGVNYAYPAGFALGLLLLGLLMTTAMRGKILDP